MISDRETLFSTLDSLVSTSVTPAEEQAIVAETAEQVCSKSVHTNLQMALRQERVNLEGDTLNQLSIFAIDILNAARERINMRRKR